MPSILRILLIKTQAMVEIVCVIPLQFWWKWGNFVVSEDTIGTQIGDACGIWLAKLFGEYTPILVPSVTARYARQSICLWACAAWATDFTYKSLCAPHAYRACTQSVFLSYRSLEQLKRIDEILCNQLNDFFWWRVWHQSICIHCQF